MNAIIAHPSPAVAEGLVLVLRRHGQFEKVQAANDLQTLLDFVRADPPSVVVLHADLPGLDYEIHIPQVRSSASDCAVAVLATTKDLDDARKAMQAGARAYLTLDVAPEELSRQLAMAATGNLVVSAVAADGIADVMAAQPASSASSSAAARSESDLSERELEVLRLIALGRTNNEIADTLTLTGNTVKAHVRSILRKLQLRNRQQATAFAVQKGLLARVELPPEDPTETRSGSPDRAIGKPV